MSYSSSLARALCSTLPPLKAERIERPYITEEQLKYIAAFGSDNLADQTSCFISFCGCWPICLGMGRISA